MKPLPFNPAETHVLASVSGGKDSGGMWLWLREQGIECERAFCDTGWEHADTYRYIREVLEPQIGPILWLRADVPLDGWREELALKFEGMLGHYSAMVRLILKKGMFPSRMRRFCTEALKVLPIRAHILGRIAEGRTVVNAVGIRALESAARAGLPEWEPWGADARGDVPAMVWRPLIGWTEADVIAIHKRHGLAPNPLYLRGSTRVGCWPCIHARKQEIALIARVDPVRIAIIRELEAVVEEQARERARIRAATPWPERVLTVEAAERALEAAILARPAGEAAAREYLEAHGAIMIEEWQAPELTVGAAEAALDDARVEAELRDPAADRHDRCYFQGPARNGVMHIDDVIAWANTDHGGKQYPLFDDLLDNAASDGCMRWGMCETPEMVEDVVAIAEPRGAA